MIEYTFEEVKKIYENDWSVLKGASIDLKEANCEGIILPKDTNFFQTLKGKSLEGCAYINLELDAYDFKNVYLRRAHFKKESKFPKDKEIFRKVYSKDIGGCVLPQLDLNLYNLNEVYIAGSDFRGCVMTKERNFFQNICRKKATACTFPILDMNNYDFNDVSIECCNFDENSTMAKDLNFFQKIKDKSVRGCRFPIQDYSNYNFKDVDINYSNLLKMVCENIDKYNLDDFEHIDLSRSSYDNLMTKNQFNVVSLRYREKIENGNLILPKVLKENPMNYEDRYATEII